MPFRDCTHCGRHCTRPGEPAVCGRCAQHERTRGGLTRSPSARGGASEGRIAELMARAEHGLELVAYRRGV
jgi:hypothetical protein